jgi:ABC-type multidrug transport system ATPase subunit
MQKILEIQQLSKHYGNIKAVNKLNLEVEQGQVFGILGPNGSGKTTTLSVIMGIIKHQSGSFTWFGNSGSDTAGKRRLEALLKFPIFTRI